MGRPEKTYREKVTFQERLGSEAPSQEGIIWRAASAEPGVFREKQQDCIFGTEGTRVKEVPVDGGFGGIVNFCC